MKNIMSNYLSHLKDNHKSPLEAVSENIFWRLFPKFQESSPVRFIH